MSIPTIGSPLFQKTRVSLETSDGAVFFEEPACSFLPILASIPYRQWPRKQKSPKRRTARHSRLARHMRCCLCHHRIGIDRSCQLHPPECSRSNVDRIGCNGPAIGLAQIDCEIRHFSGTRFSSSCTAYGSNTYFYVDEQRWPDSSFILQSPPQDTDASYFFHPHGIDRDGTSGLFPLAILGQIVTISTQLIFAIVCFGVLILRYTHPELNRPFKVPLAPFVPALGSIVCIGLMGFSPAATWLQLLCWLSIGMIIYFLYSRHHSKLRREKGLLPKQ